MTNAEKPAFPLIKITKWQLTIWNPFQITLGNGNWWIARHQGRFMDYYLCAN